MSALQAANRRSEPTMSATFNYVRINAQSQGGQDSSNAPLFEFKAVEKPLLDGRTCDFHLKGDGIQLLRSPQILLPFHGEIVDVNPRELNSLVRTTFTPISQELTKATDVIVFPALVRSERPTKVAANQVNDLRAHRNAQRPHDIVHNDYALGYDEFIRTLSPEELRSFLNLPKDMDCATLSKRIKETKRIVVLQFWGSAQPENTTIEDHPLAICAPRSVRNAKQLIPAPLPDYGGKQLPSGFNVYLANERFAQENEWIYFPKMTRKEMLVWVGYDSLVSPLLPPFHSAFSIQHDPQRTPHPRESVEIRAMCLLDHEEPFFPAISHHQQPKGGSRM